MDISSERLVSSSRKPFSRTSLLRFNHQDGLRWRSLTLALLLIVVAIVARRPDAIFNPQFYAEDGSVWYADAYGVGWIQAFALPSGGYLNTFQRLAAAVALLVPFHLAPLLMNLLGIVTQALPAVVLLSRRCSHWAPLPVRILMAALYVALPNASEIHVNITNSQFHLALLAFVLLLSQPPRRWALRLADTFIIVLSGLSGPFGLVMLPVLAAFWWSRRYRWSILLGILLAVCSAIQLSVLIVSTAGRPALNLGASPILLLQLLVRQVFLGAFFGGSPPLLDTLLAIVLLGIGGLLFLTYAALRVSLELRLFMAFSFALFLAALSRPLVHVTGPVWPALLQSHGLRYWFFPMLAVLWPLAWLAFKDPVGRARVVWRCLLILSTIGIVHGWTLPAYQDHRFPLYARWFEQAPEGTLASVPLYPQGWELVLVKGVAKCSDTPAGAIDVPARDSQLVSGTRVYGWVSGPKQIKAVLFYVDAVHLGSTSLTDIRPDVDRLLPPSDSRLKGWHGFLDLSALPAGPHRLRAFAQEQSGCQIQFAATSFTSRAFVK